MNDTTLFDSQLADMVWMVATILRAAYSLPQVFEQLASEIPEPTSSACGEITADLKRGISLEQALTNWQQSIPSQYLKYIDGHLQEVASCNSVLHFYLL